MSQACALLLESLQFHIIYLKSTKYEGRSFNSGANEHPYHMAVRNSWKLLYYHAGVCFNNGSKLCLKSFPCSKVIESSNMHSRNTLAKIEYV